MILFIRFLPVIYLVLINIAAYALYGIDKRRAEYGRWRIPEKVLILLAVFGGSIGALLGMRSFHHKTRKWYFRFGIPAILILQLAAILLFFAWDMDFFTWLSEGSALVG